jgi:hypothetical protein
VLLMKKHRSKKSRASVPLSTALSLLNKNQSIPAPSPSLSKDIQRSLKEKQKAVFIERHHMHTIYWQGSPPRLLTLIRFSEDRFSGQWSHSMKTTFCLP